MFKNRVLVKTEFVKELYNSKNHHAQLIQQSKTFPDYEICIDVILVKKRNIQNPGPVGDKTDISNEV